MEECETVTHSFFYHGGRMHSIACNETSNQGIFLWNFITGLHFIVGIDKPLKNNCDYKTDELYSKKDKGSSKQSILTLNFWL